MAQPAGKGGGGGGGLGQRTNVVTIPAVIIIIGRRSHGKGAGQVDLYGTTRWNKKKRLKRRSPDPYWWAPDRCTWHGIFRWKAM